jgi:hypothetical protein
MVYTTRPNEMKQVWSFLIFVLSETPVCDMFSLGASLPVSLSPWVLGPWFPRPWPLALGPDNCADVETLHHQGLHHQSERNETRLDCLDFCAPRLSETPACDISSLGPWVPCSWVPGSQGPNNCADGGPLHHQVLHHQTEQSETLWDLL